MNMNKFLLGATTLLFATVACADIPQLNYDCPTNIAVHADEGGPVFINGKETKLKKFNDNAYEAKGSGVVISLTRNPDESWDVSYTGKGGANGVCKPATSGGTPATSKAEEACLTEVAKQTGLATSKLSVTDVMTAEAGIGVTINVPGADGPWSCLSDESGKIQGASYTGSEGKL